MRYLTELVSTALDSRAYVLYFLLVNAIFLAAFRLSISIGNRNLSRKTFHLVALALFSKVERLNVLLGDLVVYIATCLAFTDIMLTHFHFLLKKNEGRKDCFSLSFLVLSLVAVQDHLTRPEFIRLLLSLCIHDTFASLIGGLLRKTKKSVEGMIGGVIASCLFEYVLLRSVAVPYHFLMGAVEYACTINDNIVISLSSIIYSLGYRYVVGIS